MKKRILGIFSLFLFSLLLIVSIPVGSRAAEDEVVMYFFWTRGCFKCKKEKPLLKDLENKYPQLKVKRREVSGSQENQDLMKEMGEAYGKDVRGAPVTFLGERAWVGYTDKIGQQIKKNVESCVERGDCIDPKDKLERSEGKPEEGSSGSDSVERETLDLPFFGSVNLRGIPALGSTALIAFVDGFNPCSLWVLTFLLGIVIHARSRRKTLLVGMTFLLVTATAYGLFILGAFSAFQYIGKLFWIRLAVSLIAFSFGIVSLKDYFWFKKGISFTIPEDYKPKIAEKIRNIMGENNSLFAMAGATALLALGVTLVELPCTAGFPVIWTGMISAADVNPAMFAVLLVLYLVIYLADEFVIFISAALTLSSERLGEKHGRTLKLIGGNLMLVLAGGFLFAPELLYDISGTAVVFGITALVTILIIFFYEVVLPGLDKRLGG